MPDSRLPFGIPESELALSYSRSSGPGGQNVNKTSSKATLRWDPFRSPALPADVRERFVRAYGSRLTRDGELVLHAQRHRDQQAADESAGDAAPATEAALASAGRAGHPVPGRPDRDRPRPAARLLVSHLPVSPAAWNDAGRASPARSAPPRPDR